jgi:hypothetical protein
MPFRRAALLAAACLLIAATSASAAAAAPRSLRVCPNGRTCIKSIQRAVTLSRPGDTISISPGIYRESVLVRGRKHAGIRLVGNPKEPGDVIIDGSSVPSTTPAGIAIQLTRDVSISGVTVRTFPKAGITVSGSASIRLASITTHDTGAYGVRVTNSTGGAYDGIEAYAASTAVSIGATLPQEKPRRTYVRRLTAHESLIGFEAINARYVTLTRARLFNNGTGIALTTSGSLPYPPVEDNLIRANEVFWNNYDAGGEADASPVRPAAPSGAGIYLFGSRANVIELNQVYGNWLVGLGASPNYLLALAQPENDAAQLKRNVIRLNHFGLDKRDRNGRDIAYDGSGRGNCFEQNTGVAKTVPEDGSTLVPCLPPTTNVGQPAAFDELRSWLSPEEHWIRHTHASKPGLRPIEKPSGTATPASARVG